MRGTRSWLPAATTGRQTSPVYNEVLHEVSDRISRCGSIGKSDVGALLFWKRLRTDTPWVRELTATPDARVRAVTAAAVNAVRDASLRAGSRVRGPLRPVCL